MAKKKAAPKKAKAAPARRKKVSKKAVKKKTGKKKVMKKKPRPVRKAKGSAKKLAQDLSNLGKEHIEKQTPTDEATPMQTDETAGPEMKDESYLGSQAAQNDAMTAKAGNEADENERTDGSNTEHEETQEEKDPDHTPGTHGMD